MIRRALGFGLYVAVPALLSAVSVPIVIRYGGRVAYGGIASSQALSALFAIVVGYGWGVIGPTTVAVLPTEEQAQYYLDSLASRLVILIVTSPALAVGILLLTKHNDNLAADLFMGFSVVVTSLGSSWFYVGRGEPRKLLLFILAPDLATTIVGVVAMVFGAGLTAYAALQLAGAAVAAAATLRNITSGSVVSRFDWSVRHALERLRQRDAQYAVIQAVTTAAYVNAPVLVVAKFCTPLQVSAYGLADKLQNIALYATLPATQLSQSYVPAGNKQLTMMSRARRAIVGSAGIGLMAAVAFVCLVPTAAHLLSVGRLHVGFGVSFGLGVSLIFLQLNNVIGLACLPSLGAIKRVAQSTALGALVCVCLAIWWVNLWGAAGVAWAVATGSAAVSVSLFVTLRRAAETYTDPDSNGDLPAMLQGVNDDSNTHQEAADER